MKMVVTLIAGLAVVVLGLGAYVRLAPSDPAYWSVDPEQIANPVDERHFLLRPVDGDAAGPVYGVSPEAVLAAFDAVAQAAPRTSVLAGSVASGQITYISRSSLWGFPDYISVRAVPVAEGAALAIYSRSRFGKSDLGVNKARIEDWLAQLDDSLGRR
ncbi:DUF1499 domain-containing protein [Pseudoruegeria sp. SK021]|uniref:DUF1499 domain-containing protein n=1 Tax=Pseudoruegeria sp. SK021 TaxID=1933035 RepID=UPI000A2367D1|nr:DUF1499 domain-containing protein [Pseudoruegeria sp. SK021]OSP55427.1 hypothetical protein BV911_07185 [Pseudoruegeria sp. SK021]